VPLVGPKRSYPTSKTVCATVIACFAYLLGACTTQVEESKETSAEAIAELTTISSTTTTSTSSTTTSVVAQTTVNTNLNPFGGDSPEDRLMPDVVCMNLQAAQNEIQDQGVFFSRSEDATGASRSQILDRNWVVVRQTPAAGQPIGEFEAVLYVVKIGESTGGVC